MLGQLRSLLAERGKERRRRRREDRLAHRYAEINTGLAELQLTRVKRRESAERLLIERKHGKGYVV